MVRVGKPPYQRIQVVVNPAAGKHEPILNVLNDVFHPAGVDWDVRITHKYGDAARLTREAIEDGVDLVAGYGGDGTQHEVANAVVRAAQDGGRRVPIGLLPGGTGNGFSRELGTPRNLKAAAELLCTSKKTAEVDVGRIRASGKKGAREELFIQRVYLGMDKEQQTSREEKNRFGVLAYPVSMMQRPDAAGSHQYSVVADGEKIEPEGTRIYLVNSGMTGAGLRVLPNYSVNDGYLDCFLLDRNTLATLTSAAARFLDLRGATASRYYRRCKTISIDAEPDQAVWADGEHVGRTPVDVDVLPGALSVVVP
jgi:diacylglycerol kinase (ATP)